MVFINFPHESFTPTHSGALATIIWECCRVAKSRGEVPSVVTIAISEEPFGWNDTYFVRNPAPPGNRVSRQWQRVRQRLSGWRFGHQAVYWSQVQKVVRKRKLYERPMVVMNDPEGAIYLKKVFPKSTVLLWFQNQLESALPVRNSLTASGVVVIACSNFTARWLEGYYRLHTHSVHTVYNGVDAAQFACANKASNVRLRINFSGRTISDKGPDLVLEAALVLCSRGISSFDIQILGWNHWDRFERDEYQEKLLSLAGRLQKEGVAVNFRGRISRAQIVAELQNADIHVVPSRWDEAFGITTVEGMACGLATIGSRTGGTPEVIGSDGLLFERDSVEGLSKHLELLLSSPKALAEYQTRARSRAQQFGWERTWSRLLEVCDTAHAQNHQRGNQ